MFVGRVADKPRGGLPQIAWSRDPDFLQVQSVSVTPLSLTPAQGAIFTAISGVKEAAMAGTGDSSKRYWKRIRLDGLPASTSFGTTSLAIGGKPPNETPFTHWSRPGRAISLAFSVVRRMPNLPWAWEINGLQSAALSPRMAPWHSTTALLWTHCGL